MRLFFANEPWGGRLLAQSPKLVRAIVILAVLAANLGIGLVVIRGDHTAVPLTILAVSGAFLGLSLLNRAGRSEIGLLLVPLAAGLLDMVTLPTGTASRIVMSLLVAFGWIGLWILQWIVVDKRVRLSSSRLNAPVLGFIVISIASYAWSNLLRDPMVIVPPSFRFVQLAALAVNVSLPFLVLLVSNKIHDVQWLKWLNWIVIGLGVLAASSLLFKSPIARLIDNGSRGVFPAWVGALVCAHALFNQKLTRWQRALLLALLGVMLYVYFFKLSDWYSGWMPLGTALGVIVFRRSKKWFLVALLVGGVYLATNPAIIQKNVIGQAQNKGDFERLDLWHNALQLVAQHPLLGVGPAGYAPYYMTYHPQDARSTHNNYFDVVAQTGVVGFLAYLWLWGTLLYVCVVNCRQLVRQANFDEAFATATLAGGVAAMVAMMLGDWVLPFAYNQTITGFDNASFTWILLGAAVALHHIVAARDSTAKTDAPQHAGLESGKNQTLA